MPTTRRTRAMGLSPGGPKALDMNAPSRKPRKAKVAPIKTNVSAPAPKIARSKAGKKRKQENVDEEEPSPKKARLIKDAEECESSESSPATSQMLMALSDLETEFAIESRRASQEGQPALEAQLVTESRVNAQQPTPPAEVPVNESVSTPLPPASEILGLDLTNSKQFHTVCTKNELEQNKKNLRRISNIIRRTRAMREEMAEEEEEEKALSDCDDDEWARRYPSVMERIKNPRPFLPLRNSDYQKRSAGSRTESFVRDTEHKDSDTREKGDPSALSASLDWFESNHSIPTPTAAEMTSMLKNFAQSKKALQSQAVPDTPRQNAQNSTTDSALNLNANDHLAKSLHPSKLSYDGATVEDCEESKTEHDKGLTANSKESRVDVTEPRTPVQRREAAARPQQREVANDWASSLSASAVGNLIRTPLNWFTRRDRTQQNISATEPRPTRALIDTSKSPRPLTRSSRPKTPAHGSKMSKAKISSSHAQNNNLPPTTSSSTPTPATNPSLRRRADSHLPIHLRGTRYEDLPPEWQAVSQHMKKPSSEPSQLTEQEKIDLVGLLEIAKVTRAERAALERAERNAKEQQRVSEGGEVSPEHRVRANTTSTGTFSADVYSSSSDEEEDVRGEYYKRWAIRDRNPGKESYLKRKKRRSVYDRNATPKKSCLKHSTPSSSDESGDGCLAKKPRREETVTDEDRAFIEAVLKQPVAPLTDIHEDYTEDRPDRARPCSFITMPPSRLAEIKEERRKWDEMHLTHEDPEMEEQLNKLFKVFGDNEMRRSIFNANPLLPEVTPFDSSSRFFAPQPHPRNVRRDPEPKKVEFEEPEKVSDEESDHEEEPLQEVSNTRLNKAREQALKYKPKIPSSLSQTKIMSPIHDKTIRGVINDLEVAAAIAAIPEKDIIAEGFGKWLSHKESSISREATKVGKPNFT